LSFVIDLSNHVKFRETSNTTADLARFACINIHHTVATCTVCIGLTNNASLNASLDNSLYCKHLYGTDAVGSVQNVQRLLNW